MKTWINVYDLDLLTIEEIKIGDTITQGNISVTVLDIDYDWHFKDGAFIKFFTKIGEPTFRMNFDRLFNPGHVHKHHKELLDSK